MASSTQMSIATDYSLHTGPVHDEILYLNVSSYNSHLSELYIFFQKDVIKNKIRVHNAKASAAVKPPVVLV